MSAANLAVGWVPAPLLCLTIVGIPFGMQCFRVAGSAFDALGGEVA